MKNNDQRPTTNDRSISDITRNHFPWIFLLSWIIVNLLQSYFTGLFNDESYYYYYSRDLAWGYYDHPPVTALLIWMGYGIFHNALGVRLFFVLLTAGTILIIHKLSDVKNELLFRTIAFSFLVVQIIGFAAIPDTPLLFFTALFFLVYKRFSESHSYKNAIFLGLVMAGMLYSKYLGVLIIFFTVISDYKLLFKKTFWLSVVITTLLFLPHLAWQYRHDFPSVYYHLVERSHDEHFRWNNFGDYILGQFGLFNPFLFIPAVYFLAVFRPGNKYEKAIKFTAAGSLLLPFLMMLKGRVEANWSMAGLLPFFLVAYKAFEHRNKIHRFVYYSGAVSIALIFLLRFSLIFNILPEGISQSDELVVSKWKGFCEEISRQAGNRPVVFIGGYQPPSHYIFETGKEAFVFNDALYRSNQFDLEKDEKNLQGRDAVVIFARKNLALMDYKENGIELNDSILTPKGRWHYIVFETNFRSYNYIRADIGLEEHSFRPGEEANIPVTLVNTLDKPVIFRNAEPGKVKLTYLLLQGRDPVSFADVQDLTPLVLNDSYKTSFYLKMPEKKGTYYLRVSIRSKWLPPGVNSRLFRVVVE